MNKILLLAVMASTALIAGCASVPSASNELKNSVTLFKPAPQSAGLYIFGPPLHLAKSLAIKVDGHYLGEIAGSTYFYLPVELGKHDIAAEGRRASFTAEDGRNYCFVMGLAGLSSITEDKARVKATKYSISIDSGPSLQPGQPRAILKNLDVNSTSVSVDGRLMRFSSWDLNPGHHNIILIPVPPPQPNYVQTGNYTAQYFQLVTVRGLTDITLKLMGYDNTKVIDVNMESGKTYVLKGGSIIQEN